MILNGYPEKFFDRIVKLLIFMNKIFETPSPTSEAI